MTSYQARYQSVKKLDHPERELIVLLNENQEETQQNSKTKQNIINFLAQYYVDAKTPQKIKDIVIQNQQAFKIFSKPRAAKITKNLIDYVAQVPNSEQLQIQLCRYLINWCITEKRTHLKYRVEVRLAALLLATNKAGEALKLIEPILNQVRKADDKNLLVQLYLIQSKINHGIKNYAKAKASLTASRAASNAVYCQPLLIAEIDLMSGILYAHDKDFKTAYSYFYEAFECFCSNNDLRAINSFKYMILCKIVRNSKDQINQLLNGKYGLKYAHTQDVKAIKAVSEAHFKQSIVLLRQVMQQYPNEIQGDSILSIHIKGLYQNLLEKNLFKIIQTYTRIQIDYISKKIQLDEIIVQKKLSQMILDKKIKGTLDQANNCLIIYHDLPVDNLYKNSQQLMINLNEVVDKLFERSNQLKKV